MANENWKIVYKDLPDIKSLDDVVNYFLKTLLPTNRRWSFFVDWAKVRSLLNLHRAELGILGAIIDADDKTFRDTIKKYPNVIKVFPLLMAVRQEKFTVLLNPENLKYADFDFTILPKGDKEVDKYLQFWKESGLKAALQEVKSLKDYYYGVEVGSDTNARKNRGGIEWENLIEPIIQKTAKDLGANIRIREKFEKVLKEENISPLAELKRNMDFLVYKHKKYIDIEANFFSGAGTKLEVPGAYTNRTFDEGFSLSLFLFTDGLGWPTAKQRIKEYFEKFPCVCNFEMAKKGVLKRALEIYLK